MHLFKILICNVWLNRFLFYTAVISGCFIAFTPVESGLQPNLDDKLLHSASFFVLACLLQLAHPNLKAWLSVLVLMILGIFIELVQAMIPYRSFEWLDWAADISGCLIYMFLFSGMVRKLILNNKSELG